MRRIITASLASVSLIVAWAYMGKISHGDPWYRNLDMNIHNLDDALSINSGSPPSWIDQPGVPMKYLLALDFRARHYLGHFPIWNLKKFGDSAEPISEIAPLVRAGRLHSRFLVVGCILAAGALVYCVSRRVESACLALILLCGSSGLLFQGLLIRPELLCVGFGNVLALLCTWRGVAARSWFRHHLWLLLAGVFIGFSALEKLPGVCYFPLCYAWCWLTAAMPSVESDRDRHTPAFSGGLVPVLGSLATLCLLHKLGPWHSELGPVVTQRLRVVAVIFATLPLLSLWPRQSHLGSFLLARARELALLASGVLFAFPLCYLLFRGVLSESSAGDYMARTLHLLVDPAPLVRIVAANQRPGEVFMEFFRADWFLFVSTPLLALGIFLSQKIQRRFKAFIALLLAAAFGMTLVMCKRHFLAQYTIFPQVPFLIVWSLCLFEPGIWLHLKALQRTRRWAVAAVCAIPFIFVLTGFTRLDVKYTNYQYDAMLPVSDLSLAFLYDHDAHTPGYLAVMRNHYRSREHFAAVLDRYLTDPAHRY